MITFTTTYPSKKRLISTPILIGLLLLSTHDSQGKEAHNFKITKDIKNLRIENCIEEKCKPVLLPKKLIEQFEENYEITIDNIDRNNTPEIVATAHGANRCSTFYKYDGDTN